MCKAACVEFKREPQCAKCIDPLFESNADAVRIWLITESQMIAIGMEGAIVGVNQLAVWEAIDRYKAKEPVKTFEKVVRLFNEITMEIANRREGGD